MNKKKKGLIVYTHGGGRFANQMICYAHLIAFVAENNYRYDLINMSFWQYLDLFESKSVDILCTFPNQSYELLFLNTLRGILQILSTRGFYYLKIIIIRLLNIYSSLIPNYQSISAKNLSNPIKLLGVKKEKLDLNSLDDISLFDTVDVTILSGWNIRSWTLFEKHKSVIKDKLLFKKEYVNKSKKFIDELRIKHGYLIGVLIRQGDYRRWRNGKFFFETEQYIDWIKQIRADCSDSHNIGFVIASDESKVLENFDDLNVVFTTGIAGGDGHYIESMIELSLCDLIISPPSTFAAWASFIGDVPLLPLYQKNQFINLNNEECLCKNILDIINNVHMSFAVK
jgi:hypothetical protein